jgi:hypothetical protein
MFGKPFVRQLISRSAENEEDRRRFLRSASTAGLGLVGASLAASLAGPALAETTADDSADGAISDSAILNFALNLEYLEAEFYSYATTGHGLPSSLTHGRGNHGEVIGGKKVPFRSKFIRECAEEIARDEHEHVAFLRSALGSAKVARPKINIKYSFTQAARAAGLVGPRQAFDPYANENNFLLGAYIFEDVGVTAYKGAAPLISNKTYLGAAAGSWPSRPTMRPTSGPCCSSAGCALTPTRSPRPGTSWTPGPVRRTVTRAPSGTARPTSSRPTRTAWPSAGLPARS